MVALLKQNDKSTRALGRKKLNILAEQFSSIFIVDDEEAAGTFLFGSSYPTHPGHRHHC